MRTPPVVLALLLPGFAHAQDYYLVTIGRNPVGWMREQRISDSAGVRVAGTMHMALNRLGARVIIEVTQESVESPAGALRSLDVSTRMSEQRVRTTVVVSGRRATVTTRAGESGRPFERTADLPDSLLGPEAVRRLTLALSHPNDSVQYLIWDAQSNTPSRMTRVLVARDSLSHVLERSSATPIVTALWLDVTGRLVKTQYELPFGRTEAVLTDSATAFGAVLGSLPEESYTRTIARTSVRLPRAREIEMLRLRLELTDTSIAMPDLRGPGQAIEANSQTVKQSNVQWLTVVRRFPQSRALFPVASTPSLREFLEPNAYVQSDDPRIVETARRVVGGERDVYRAALALRRWVADSMRFDLGVAFAPAAEVIERRRGTCVAYATLLAALTRAVGIPSRIAMGYAYVNGMFGGHAWTEVLVGDAWIPVDAALVSDGAADAARFAFAWSSLATGPAALTGNGSQLYGRLSVSVEAYMVAGRTYHVPSGERAYTVDGDSYRNEWLGIEITKPSGFRFEELDETWPKATVVAFEREGERVRVLLRARKPWDTAPAKPNEVRRGLDVFVIEVQSPRAAELGALARSSLRVH